MSMETPNTTYKNTFAYFIEFLLIRSVFFISKKLLITIFLKIWTTSSGRSHNYIQITIWIRYKITISNSIFWYIIDTYALFYQINTNWSDKYTKYFISKQVKKTFSVVETVLTSVKLQFFKFMYPIKTIVTSLTLPHLFKILRQIINHKTY